MSLENAKGDLPHGIPLRCFLGWMVCSAVLLALQRPLSAIAPAASHQFAILLALYRTTDCIVYGLAVTGIVVMGLRWAQGKLVLHHPGHWVLAIEGTGGSLRLVQLSYFDRFANGEGDAVPILLAIGGVHLMQGILFIVAATVARIQLSCRALLLACAVPNLVAAARFAGIIGIAIPLPGPELLQDAVAATLAMLMCLAAFLLDKFRCRRDWLHFTGMLLVMWNAFTQLSWAWIMTVSP